MIGKVIKKNRKKMGLTQAQLAEKAGVSRGSVATAETGKTNPKDWVVEKLAKAFGTTVEEMRSQAAIDNIPVSQSEDLTAIEVLLLENYRQLSMKKQIEIFREVDKLAAEARGN